MVEQLLLVFGYMFFISLTAFSGSAQALFYEFAVDRTHWINPHDFATYLSFGFATPGPQLFSIATFIGYSAAGFPGAIAGTIGIYAMPCILAVLAGRYLGRYIHHQKADYFLQAIGLAGSGVLIAIGINLLRVNSISFGYGLIAAASFAAVARFKLNPLFIIITGGLIGAVFLN